MSLSVYLEATRVTEVYSGNITHNLGPMARECGVYAYLWAPATVNVKTAGELIEPLSSGLARLKADPDHFRKFDASNGWGVYSNLVEFIERYLSACEENKDALVSVSV